MTLVYTAIAPCGCVHAADFEDGPETHALIADWVKSGSRVERVPDLDGITFTCSHSPKWGRSDATCEIPDARPFFINEQRWPKLVWVCDHCGHWHGASYATWTIDKPPLCKVKGYGRDSKSACGRPMRGVLVVPKRGLGRRVAALWGRAS